MGVPTSASVFAVLTQGRLGELARGLGVSIPSSGRKDVQIARLLDGAQLPLPALLGHLYRDELRAACREHELTTETRSREELAGRLLDAAAPPRSHDTIPPLLATTASGDTPKAGDVGARLFQAPFRTGVPPRPPTRQARLHYPSSKTPSSTACSPSTLSGSPKKPPLPAAPHPSRRFSPLRPSPAANAPGRRHQTSRPSPRTTRTTIETE